jgi:hypothetical protein
VTINPPDAEEHPMTDTDTAAASAELEPAIAGALELLKDKPETKLDDLAELVAVVEAVAVSAEAAPWPALPKHIELTEECRRAMDALPGVFGKVELGDKRRSLTAAELKLLTSEVTVIGLISKVLGPRLDAIKETIRVHMDVDAEERGVAVARQLADAGGTVIVAATPRDQSGHYLLAGPGKPHEIPVGSVVWQQQYSAGAAKPNDAELKAALDAGDIDRKTWLAITREVRKFDAVKFSAFLRKNPRDGLRVLRRITRKGRPQASLYLREVK